MLIILMLWTGYVNKIIYIKEQQTENEDFLFLTAYAIFATIKTSHTGSVMQVICFRLDSTVFGKIK